MSKLLAPRDGSPWYPKDPVPVTDLSDMYQAMAGIGIPNNFVSVLADQWNDGISSGSTKAYVVYVGGEAIWVIGDGSSTSVFSTVGKGSILIAESAPADLFAATSEMRGIWSAADSVGKGLDLFGVADGFLKGVGSAPPGSDLKTQVIFGLGGALPELGSVLWQNGVFAAGTTTCSLTGAGAVVSGICGAGAVLLSQLLLAPLNNPGAPASCCSSGSFDADEANAMGFQNTSEGRTSC